MDQSAQGQGCQGMLHHVNSFLVQLTDQNFQLSIAEERDRRRAVALAAH